MSRRVEVSPAALGSVAVGSTKTMAATLGAPSSAVTVTSATTTNAEFTISGITFPATIAAGKTIGSIIAVTPINNRWSIAARRGHSTRFNK